MSAHGVTMCGHVDHSTQRVCDRSKDHPGNHLDVPGGEEW